MSLDITHLKNRVDLAKLLGERGLSGWGVEVGVHAGWYSDVILEHSKLERVFSVDAWNSEEPGLPAGMTDLEAFKMTADALWKYGYRSVMIRQKSVDAAKIFADKSLDFIYIDANHTYEAICSDIEAWWPKIKPGGIFSGHDFNECSPEIKQAVWLHCKRHDLPLWLTECDFMHEIKGHGTLPCKDYVIRSWMTEAPHG
jgi:hypothetical protein